MTYFIGFLIGVVFTVIAEIAVIVYLVNSPANWGWRGSNQNKD